MGRNFQTLLILLLLCAGLSCHAATNSVLVTNAVARFPVRAGVYVNDEWTYKYDVQREGLRSERRIGRLYRGGRLITARIGSVTNTPVGIFCFFSASGGWLNTLSGDRPVFDEAGQVDPTLVRHFSIRRLRENAEAADSERK